MNKLLFVCAIFVGCLSLISAGGGGGGFKGGGFKGGGYKGADDGGGGYQAAPTAAPVADPTAAPVVTTVQLKCITDGNGLCTGACTIGTYTVEDASYSCDGNGAGTVCCLEA